MDEVKAVARAIKSASCPGREGPFGGYDYGYNEAFYGPAPEGGRYVIRDFRDPSSPDWGAWLHQTNDRDEHESMFAKMTDDHVAQAAIAALDAARGNAEPVAASRKWANALANIRQGRRSEPLCEPPSEYAIENALEWLKDALLASPTPLYAHPPAPDAARGDPVARVVEWLRACSLSSAIPDDPAQMIADLADAIERGEPFNA